MKQAMVLAMAALMLACQNSEQVEEVPVEESKEEAMVKSWMDTAVIYEVNIRQYTPEGTFAAFQEHLPRLKKLGVDILWLMPIHPIGEKNRKGGLGSYYSIKDYKAVNPEHGTLEDFKKLVDAAHEQGFKVILDWVANHSAWDNPWVEANPDWYTRDSASNMISPWDWTDVADLNYDNPDMRAEMLESMRFWMRDYGVDGYRCDVAFLVPTDFWQEVRAELEKINPEVFMLAEAEEPEHHNAAFHASYGWHIHHAMNKVAQGEMPLDSLVSAMIRDQSRFPKEAYRMMFTSNHDENSWNGTTEERMGDYHKLMSVLSFTLPNSFPLIYSGQEAGLNKRLSFFEKDTIIWNESEMTAWYQKLTKVKHNVPMIWNGTAGAPLESISQADGMLWFNRKNEKGDLWFIGNFSEEPKTVGADVLPEGSYGYLFRETDKPIEFDANTSIELGAYEFVVFFSC